MEIFYTGINTIIIDKYLLVCMHATLIHYTDYFH